jgi:hypothetical protein
MYLLKMTAILYWVIHDIYFQYKFHHNKYQFYFLEYIYKVLSLQYSNVLI